LTPQNPDADLALLRSFDTLVAGRIPHIEDGGTIASPTPIQDITELLVQAAKEEYGLDLTKRNLKVVGKFDSEIYGGSVKVRPAVQILRDAIVSGELKTGQTVFEATSGNFGIALGLILGKLGVRVVGLVSRKLQGGVIDELKKSGVSTVDLDVEVCPTPGSLMDANTLTAKATAGSVKSQLEMIGFETGPFVKNLGRIEDLLAKQDVIRLAQLLAEIYGGYCPRQYENEMNARAHEMVTGPEIDQQLAAMGLSLRDFRVVSSFGTGGTSAGLSGYINGAYGRRSVHVVFPLAGQDVAGIRAKANAASLSFYKPEAYAGEHEVDFDDAKRLMTFFARRGVYLGESSALNLYATIQLANFGAGNRFLVIVADGADKYDVPKLQVAATARTISFEEAKAASTEYGSIVWTHPMFVPKEEGVKFLASTFGREEKDVTIVDPRDVQRILQSNELPDGLFDKVKGSGSRHLFVCMAGVTSLSVGKAFARKGVAVDNLSGGIMGLAGSFRRQPAELLRAAQ